MDYLLAGLTENIALLNWVALELVVILIIIGLFHWIHSEKYVLLVDILFEKMYKFFEEILGKNFSSKAKSSVTSLFFVILIANFIGVGLDVLVYIFPWLEEYIIAPSSDVSFNFAVAILSVLVMLVFQFQKKWFWEFINEYLPVKWNWIVDVKRQNKPWYLYRPQKIFVKTFDILVSMFLGVLDIIWLFAKVVSLAFRLYGNMIAGSILIAMLIGAINSFTWSIVGLKLPLIAPVLLYMQSLLIGFIQAFVFALLVAIFIKVATVDNY